MAAFDPINIGESIGAAYLLISTTIGTINSRRTHKQVQTPNGETLGDIARYLQRRNHDLMDNQQIVYDQDWLIGQQLDAIGRAQGAEMPEMPERKAKLHQPGDLNETVEDLRHRSGLDR